VAVPHVVSRLDLVRRGRGFADLPFSSPAGSLAIVSNVATYLKVI